MGGPWKVGGGWGVDYLTDSIDGVPYDFTGHGLPVPSPLPWDHGWSTHGMEAGLRSLVSDPASSFSTFGEFVATVNMQGIKEQGLSGDRRAIPLYTPYRLDYDYRSTATVFDGTGAFKGVKGTLVIKGTFWMSMVKISVNGQTISVPAGSGRWDFTTTGMLCGAAGWR